MGSLDWKNPTPTQWMIGAAFNAGLAYHLRRSHPKWALFFAFNAVTGAILATGAGKPTATPFHA